MSRFEDFFGPLPGDHPALTPSSEDPPVADGLVDALCRDDEPVPPTLPSVKPIVTGEVRIVDPKTGGQKGQKPERFDLIPFDALEEVARVYGEGAKKYEDDNWLKGYRWRLSLGALLRHVARFMCGEDRDRETGCLHLAHAAWHCLTLITFMQRGLGTDDRRPPTIVGG